MRAILRDEINKLPVVQKAHIYEPKIEDVAEISFKVGMKKIVEWIERKYILPNTKLGGTIQVRNLEADLKIQTERMGDREMTDNRKANYCPVCEGKKGKVAYGSGIPGWQPCPNCQGTGRVEPKPKIPRFASEDEEREFWATHDGTIYADTATPVILEYQEPKPKKDRLLTDEEIGNALQPVCDNEAKTYYCSDTTAITCINCNPVAKAQDAKTHVIDQAHEQAELAKKDIAPIAEHLAALERLGEELETIWFEKYQARVERIFKELEDKMFDLPTESITPYGIHIPEKPTKAIGDSVWQEFKKKELGK